MTGNLSDQEQPQTRVSDPQIRSHMVTDVVHDTPHQLMQSYAFNRLTTVVVAVVVGGIGFWLIFAHAATAFGSAQAESGSVSGPAAVISDSTASGGQAIIFNGPIEASQKH